MKSRKAAKAMTEYLRTVNPGLAAAMTDERDEVLLSPVQLTLSWDAKGHSAACCLCIALVDATLQDLLHMHSRFGFAHWQ